MSLGFTLSTVEATHIGSIFSLGSPQWQDPLPLDASDSCDECELDGSLGFGVTLSGKTYTHFQQDSNGYVQLLAAAEPTPAASFGFGTLAELIADDPTATYLMAAFDDTDSTLTPGENFGFTILADRAIFYWDTELFVDDVPLGPYEVVLYQTGQIDWNFQGYAVSNDFPFLSETLVSSADLLDLYTGLYLGNTGELHHALDSNVFKDPFSYRMNAVPEPASLVMAGLGGLMLLRRRA